MPFKKAAMNRLPNETNSADTSRKDDSSTQSNVLAASNDSIKLMAESIGINNLSEEAGRELASDLSFVIKSILLVNTKIKLKQQKDKFYEKLRMPKNFVEKVVEKP